MSSSGFAENIKEPNVAGAFYSANPRELSAELDRYFKNARTAPSGRPVRIIFVPHAGYVFSGPTAVEAFKAVSGKKYGTVVVLAPTHYFPFEGAAVWSEGGFKTPLGTIPVDEDFARRLTAKHPKFISDQRVYEREHSLEVELPFLQKALKDFKIVPVIFGRMDQALVKEFAAALDSIIGDREDVLVVVSTDMSHYHDDAAAREIDGRALKVMEAVDPEAMFEKSREGYLEVDGFLPVTAALYLADRRGWKEAEVLKYSNSGEINNDKSRVVGYMAVAVYGGPSGKAEEDHQGVKPLSREQKELLLRVAREAVEAAAKGNKPPSFDVSDPRLRENEGAFVTINRNGKLRGCIGRVISDQPLYQTVRDMAVSSALKDPRFPPLREDELGEIEVEVSVLSKPWPVKDVSEIIPGKHGVIIQKGFMHQGLFLPQVATEWGWGREELLSNLCSHKAGLPPDAWKDPDTRIEIFTADVFSEEDL